MESLLVFLLITVLTSEGRLIQINRTKVEEPQTDKPNPSIRLTRDTDYILGFSNEETGQDDEFIKSYNKRTRHFFKANPDSKSPDQKGTRHIRDSNESLKDNSKKIAPKISGASKKLKTVLVKKPIPKFNEIDYDDDFQAKMNKFLTAVVDSGDHEDEDFNLDDYDFDINHDEYAGRGKHLEPRIQAKNIEVTTAKEDKKPNKIKIFTTSAPVKKGRAANAYKIASKLREVDYYEDMTTKKNKSRDDSDSADSDDSIETDQRNPSVRTIRSWNISRFANEFSGKSAVAAANLLSILPLFPQMPNQQDFGDYLQNFDPNVPIVDPMNSRISIN